MPKPLKVLIVEDCEDDAVLTVRELRRGGLDVASERVDTAANMKVALSRQPWDVVIADYAMPHFSGLDALEVLKETRLDLPFIIVSGTIGEDVAVEAMQRGAHDYLMKGKLARLVPAVERELREAEVRKQQRQAEEDLRKAHDELEQRVEERTLELGQANAELDRKRQEMEQLLYTVSHDLKSPLVTIQGFLGYVVSDAQAGRLDRLVGHCQRVQNAADRMVRLIDDLLGFSRIGRIAMVTSSVNLAELVRDVAASHVAELTQRRISLEIQADLPAIQGDKGRIHQVFDNLLVNAIKYGCGAAEPRIEIGVRPDAAEIHAFVRDNGRGIAPEFHERIFELFQRLDHEGDGVGVGLAIVKKIAEVHGGRAWVESAEGQGATFWLAFPACKTHHGDTETRREEEKDEG
jgi:signal transduction histidine kinase